MLANADFVDPMDGEISMIFNLNNEISDIGTRSIGFSGAELASMNSSINSTLPVNGTAIDTIKRYAVVTPDVVHTPWIINMYNLVADVAWTIMSILVVFAIISFMLVRYEQLSASRAAAIIHLMKKSIIVAFMTANGLPCIMALLWINQAISETFGNATSITDLLIHSLVSPLGCVMVVAGVIAVIYNALFYLIRFFMIFLSCAIWPIAWVLWMWDQTADFAMNLIKIIVINIFLGSAVIFVYWVGTIIMLSGSGPVGWGLSVMGLIIMLVAAKIPIIAYHRYIKQPIPTSGLKRLGVAVLARKAILKI